MIAVVRVLPTTKEDRHKGPLVRYQATVADKATALELLATEFLTLADKPMIGHIELHEIKSFVPKGPEQAED